MFDEDKKIWEERVGEADTYTISAYLTRQTSRSMTAWMDSTAELVEGGEGEVAACAGRLGARGRDDGEVEGACGCW